MTLAATLSIWVPIILTCLALSFVFVDWPGWRFVETLLIGGGAGHGVVMVFRNWDRLVYTPIITKGQYILLPAVVLGILMYFVYLPPKVRWLQRYGYVWGVGLGLGLIISTIIQGQILPAIKQSISIIGNTQTETVNNFVSFIIFVTVLTYFIFTREHVGPLGYVTRVGRGFLMIAFGLGFSTLLMTYFGVLLERVMWILTALGVKIR